MALTRRRRWAFAIFLFVAIDAISLQVRGALVPSFREAFDVTPGLLGLIAPAGTVGFLVAVLAVGLAAGRVRIKRTLLGGTAAAAAFLVVMGVAPTYAALLGALFVHGVALGTFRGLDRALLSHLYPAQRGRVFNVHSLAWALGAVTGPTLAAGVLVVADWRATFLLVAVGFLPVLALLRGLEVPEGMANERPLSLSGAPGLLRRPTVLGMTVALGLVGGVEGAIFTWLPFYADTSLPRSIAALALSAYLLAYVPGRLTYVAVVERVGYLPLLLATSAGAAPIAYATLVAVEGYAILAGAFALGALTSSFFPTLSALGADAVPKYSGPINAISTGVTYLGMATVPTVMGVVADREGIGVAMVIPVALVVGIVLVVAVMYGAQRV